MIRNLLGATSAIAILLGGASAQTLTPDAAAAMSSDELKEALRGTELIGYRLFGDDCGSPACSLTMEGATPQGILRAMARATADETGDPEANAPRIDESADGVVFRGRGAVLLRTRTMPQTVFLNFDQLEGRSEQFFVDVVNEDGELINVIEFDDYPYSQEDREVIRDRIAADYAKFDVRVTLERPAGNDFAILDFTDNDRDPGDNNIEIVVLDDGRAGFNSILFGRAEGIDFGNDDLGTNSFADANFWQVLGEVFTPAFFERLSNIPADVDGDGVTDAEAIDFATVNQAANTGAHEVGHTVGLRHHDAFGKPNDGLPSTGRPDPETFIPVYEGPTQADETVLHLMASGASSGLSLAGSGNQDRFLSERSALKVSLAEKSRVYDETKLRVDPRTHARDLRLFRSLVPNTIEEGANAGGRFIAMDTAWVQGSITPVSVDEYKFRGPRGGYINAEIASFTDTFVERPILSELQLFKLERDGSRTLIATNNQTFEPYDPLLLDIRLPDTGEYILQVSTPDIVYFDLNDDGVAADPLIENGLGFFLDGDYDLLVYAVDRPIGRVRRGKPMVAAD